MKNVERIIVQHRIYTCQAKVTLKLYRNERVKLQSIWINFEPNVQKFQFII